MGTRGRVGIRNNDGSVTSIYNHWDSYPSGLGKILLDNYTDEKKVRELIALGDCSSIREEVAPPRGTSHSFDNPLGNVTVAYGRDRNETDVDARTDNSEEEYYGNYHDEEYMYLFADGKWLMKECGSKSAPKVLTEKVCMDNE